MKYFLLSTILSGCGLGLKQATPSADESSESESESIYDEESPNEQSPNEPSDTQVETADYSIDEAVPRYDIIHGGKQIKIIGGPFPQDAQVSIGVNAATVLSNTITELTVIVPSSINSGDADIHVDSSGGSQTLSDGFHYFDDNTGLTGAIGYIRQITMTGDYWNPPTYDAGLASVTFLRATDVRWWELFVPQMDFCADDSFTYPDQIFATELAENKITLSRNGVGIDLNYDPSTYAYQSQELASTDFMSGTTYALEPLTGTFSGLESPNFAVTATKPIVNAPDISGISPPTLYSNPTFEWVPSNADWIHITLGLLDSTGSGYESTINCIAIDDGMFVVNTGLFGSWPSGRQVDIYVSRIEEANGILPHDNSSSRVIGENVIIGAGFIF